MKTDRGGWKRGQWNTGTGTRKRGKKMRLTAAGGHEETVVEALSTCRIILNKNLTTGVTNEPARKNKRKRTQKKWLKRYGYKPRIDEKIYVMQDENGPEAGRTIIMHPAIFKRFVKALGSEQAAAKGINKFFSEITR